MKADELLQTGSLEEALATLQEEVRQHGDDPALRVFLFQLLCVLGKWKRALTQLEVIEHLGSDYMLLARIFQPIIQCEVLRGEIFAGNRTPIILGEPLPWMSLLVQANEHVARGEFTSAQALRDEAFEAATPTAGKINEAPFEWIADADARLGPILEAIIEGHYYWIPFSRIKRLTIEPPSDLRDLVWAPAQFLWANGGEAGGHIPTRYPDTEKSSDGHLQLARKTEWITRDGGFSLGLGQRIIATDAEEYPLLECRTIDLISSA